MLRMTRTWLLTAAVASAVPTAALADDKATFQARYAQLEEAIETRELDKVRPFITPDYTTTDIAGRKQTAEEMLDRLAMVPVDPARRDVLTIDTVDVQGDTAQVANRRTRSGTREGRDGKPHTMSFVTASKDTWVRSSGSWLLKDSEAQNVTITRDGQVMRQINKGDPMPERGGRGFGRRGPGERGAGDGPARPEGPPPGDDE